MGAVEGSRLPLMLERWFSGRQAYLMPTRRGARIALLAIVVAYGTLLRLDALTLTYGVVELAVVAAKPSDLSRAGKCDSTIRISVATLGRPVHQ